MWRSSAAALPYHPFGTRADETQTEVGDGIALEDAVRRMTSLPARTFGFRDRGLVRPGSRADLVLFDPARVEDKATFDKPHQFSEGFTLVLVNGRAMVRDGRLTSERAVKVLRHSTT